MDVQIDTSYSFTPHIIPPIVLTTVSPKVVDYPNNSKAKILSPLVENPFGDAKVEVVPQVENLSVNIKVEVPPLVVNHSSDH